MRSFYLFMAVLDGCLVLGGGLPAPTEVALSLTCATFACLYDRERIKP